MPDRPARQHQVSTRAPAKAQTGRPSKLTDAVAKAIVDAIAVGVSFKTACRLAGIAPATGHDWLQRGHGEHPRRARGPHFVEFAEAITRARARDQAVRIALISHAVETERVLSRRTYTEPDGTLVEEVRYFELDWPAEVTSLERCPPEPFGNGVRFEGSADGPPINEEAR